ncbi:MAG: hypothetical protein DMC59_06835, partial [Verrucomicrobia bacterium]
MGTVHNEIDNWLAADLYGDLSDAERSALHAHLLDCAACRKAHQETKTMNKILEETLAQEKPDPAFEQRVLAGFRQRVPQRVGLVKLLGDLMRLRAAQITAVAAMLLGLVQIGRMITGEGATPASKWGYLPGAAFPVQQANAPSPTSGVENAKGTLDKTNELSRGRSDFAARAKSDIAPAAPPLGVEDQRQEALAFAAKEPRKEAVAKPAETPSEVTNRKLIRNATVQLEIGSFDDAVQKITAFANEEHGYVATTDSQKQANGKLRGEVVVKVLPENLDRFLQKIRGLGELKNQTLGTEDVTKAYFDTDSRLKNAHVMEQRLIDMLKTKTGKVSDLLQVEKELGRVREEIEKMQGELKYWDSQVQFATV